jgi:predicted nuclease of predicted toxin-antitoxin system
MKKNNYCLKQKINFYFDENFPQGIVSQLKNDKWFRKKCRIVSVFDKDTKRQGDQFHFDYCKKKDYALVTLDGDFWNDFKYPLRRIPGVIVLTCDGKNLADVKGLIEIFVSFFSSFPRPKYFIGDSKFKVSKRGCLMKGRDSITREIKSFFIRPGNSSYDVRRKFNWYN